MKILSFGSLNLDMVYDVTHFVQRGETLASLSLETFCGGKGLNQSIALARAGARVWHAGMIGADGELLVNRLRENMVDASNIRICSAPTGHAIIQVDSSGQNCILLYSGANRQITEQFIDDVLVGFGKGDLVLLQNEIARLPDIIEKACAKGMIIALNPSPYNGDIEACRLELVDYFLLNEVEGSQLTGKVSAAEILSEMRARFPRAKIVLTLGKQGAIYDDGEVYCESGIYEVPVVDTTAAGDTFTGYFLAAIGKGEPPSSALTLASKASAIAVSVKGASNSIPMLQEVIARFST